MLTVLAAVAVVLVIFAAAVLATQHDDLLLEAPADAADVGLPTVALQPEDVAEVRFGLALRGYRMDEVDQVLERLAHELTVRDTQIGELRLALADAAQPAPAEPEAEVPPAPEPAPAPAPAYGSWQPSVAAIVPVAGLTAAAPPAVPEPEAPAEPEVVAAPVSGPWLDRDSWTPAPAVPVVAPYPAGSASSGPWGEAADAFPEVPAPDPAADLPEATEPTPDAPAEPPSGGQPDAV